MDNANRVWNIQNPFQGKYKRVLCVCSAGLLRSPTLAWMLSNEPYNYNTRAVGLDTGHALIPIDDVLIQWADEIICMNGEQQEALRRMTKKPIINLQITDSYDYRDKGLLEIMRVHYENIRTGAVIMEDSNEE